MHTMTYRLKLSMLVLPMLSITFFAPRQLAMTIVEQSQFFLPTPEPSSSESDGSPTDMQPHDPPMTQGGEEAARTLFGLFAAPPNDTAQSRAVSFENPTAMVVAANQPTTEAALPTTPAPPS